MQNQTFWTSLALAFLGKCEGNGFQKLSDFELI